MSTVWCFARTYAAHAAELGNAVPTEPLVFLKGAQTLRGLEPGATYPQERIDHEIELVLRVGRPVAHGEKPGWDAIDAFTLGLELTLRERQDRCRAAGLPWAVAKSFAGATVLAPFLDVRTLPNRDAVTFHLEVEGAVRQHGDTTLLLHPVPTLVNWLAALAPLAPGDLLFTGTPAGVGPIRPGESFALVLHAPETRWSGRL